MAIVEPMDETFDETDLMVAFEQFCSEQTPESIHVQALQNEWVTLNAALESLQTRDGLDRAFALTYQAVLPDTLPLTSYTHTLTQTNREVVQASLEWRRVAIIATIVSAILSVITFIMRLIGQSNHDPLGDREYNKLSTTLGSVQSKQDQTDETVPSQSPRFSQFSQWNALTEVCLYGQSAAVDSSFIQLLIRLYQHTPILIRFAEDLTHQFIALRTALTDALTASNAPLPTAALHSTFNHFARQLAESSTGYGGFFNLMGVDSNDSEALLESGAFSPTYLYQRLNQTIDAVRQTAASRSFEVNDYLKHIGVYNVETKAGPLKIKQFGFNHTAQQLNTQWSSDTMSIKGLEKAIKPIDRELGKMKKRLEQTSVVVHPMYNKQMEHLLNFMQVCRIHSELCLRVMVIDRSVFNYILAYYQSLDQKTA
jgi:hypothetical protein